MRIHTYTPLSAGVGPAIVKHIKYKIWDFGDMCTIAFSSTHVESFRYVERSQVGDGFVEVLEKLPVGYTPSSDCAICSTVDVGLTSDPNVVVYGGFLLTISTGAMPVVVRQTQAPVPRPKNPTHTRQFKRSSERPANADSQSQFKRSSERPGAQQRASVGIPLVMPAPAPVTEETPVKKIKARLPMMSIPLVTLPTAVAAIE